MAMKRSDGYLWIMQQRCGVGKRMWEETTAATGIQTGREELTQHGNRRHGSRQHYSRQHGITQTVSRQHGITQTVSRQHGIRESAELDPIMRKLLLMQQRDITIQAEWIISSAVMRTVGVRDIMSADLATGGTSGTIGAGMDDFVAAAADQQLIRRLPGSGDLTLPAQGGPMRRIVTVGGVTAHRSGQDTLATDIRP